ncbi:MAG: hypothetical protein ACP5FK_01405 [bacterium]
MFIFLILLVAQLAPVILPIDVVDTYTIQNDPIIFEYKASSKGFLSVVARCKQSDGDIMILGRGPNSVYLNLQGGSEDSDVGGNYGFEQTIFNIPGAGTYYVMIVPYSSFDQPQSVDVMAWFKNDIELIPTQSIPMVIKEKIQDLEEVEAQLSGLYPLAVYEMESYDNFNHLLLGRVEASEDVILELYSPDNPAVYVYQSDYDLEGNAGIEQITMMSETENPIFVIRPYNFPENEIFYNFQVEAIPADIELTLSQGKAEDEGYVDPQTGLDRMLYSVTCPQEGILVVDLHGENGDLILNAYSMDTMISSDYDYEDDLGREKLVLFPGEYLLEVISQPSNMEPIDYMIYATIHRDQDASYSGAVQLDLGVKHQDQISAASYDFLDYYYFQCPQDGQYIIETMGTDYIGDLILTVENSDGEILSTSDQDINGDYTYEQCVVDLNSGDRIYIKVEPYYEYQEDIQDCQYNIAITRSE